jgi:membrane protease YdiL (CAAX protease family)
VLLRRSLLVALVVSIIYAVWFAMGAGVLEGPISLGTAILVEVVTRVLVPIAGLAILYKIGGVRPRDYWLASPFTESGKMKATGLAAASTLLLLSYVIVANMVTGLAEDSIVEGIEHGRELGGASPVLAVLSLAAIAAFSEEIFCRALPRLIFEPATPFVRVGGYMGLASIVFGLLHLPWGIDSAISAGYFGLISAVILVWTNNLWYPLVGHFLTDVLVLWWRYEKFGVLPL